MDVAARTLSRIEAHWNDDIVPALTRYIAIPAKSPHFDPAWAEAGHIEQAIVLADDWLRRQPLAGLHAEIVRLPGRTPLLYFDVPASNPAASGVVLLYGHLDKQPEMTGWRKGFGPWSPVIENDRLYGRGGADDGYAIFAAVSALAALQAAAAPHARCVGVIETCEESGSYDLPAYLELLAPRWGGVDLVIGLDSGCGDYRRLWRTTSLRGLAAGTLGVEVLTEGVHSGDASGIVPSSFRIARALLDRIEDAATGAVRVPELHCPVPAERVAEAKRAAELLRGEIAGKFPYAGRTRPVHDEPMEAALDRTWRPALSVIGADGFPPIADAGNVLRPRTALKLSMRLPPIVDADAATATMKRVLEADPPLGANVAFDPDQAATGWNAPATAAWLERAIEDASQQAFAEPACAMGEGGTIPFMAMLGRKFPAAQFLITGVLGPHSNAHGPNEFIDLPYAKRLSACVAHVIAAHAGARS